MRVDERGGVYPFTLMIVLFSLFFVAETASIYLSEYGYTSSMQDYYQIEIARVIETHRIEDESLEHLPYNTHMEEKVDQGERFGQ